MSNGVSSSGARMRHRTSTKADFASGKKQIALSERGESHITRWCTKVRGWQPCDPVRVRIRISSIIH
jgi:hypothetical protein